jgi:hypothetical protein
MLGLATSAPRKSELVYRLLSYFRCAPAAPQRVVPLQQAVVPVRVPLDRATETPSMNRFIRMATPALMACAIGSDTNCDPYAVAVGACAGEVSAECSIAITEQYCRGINRHIDSYNRQHRD